MLDLYRRAWKRLANDRERCHEIEREATPVLCFGRWRTARVATAGLNPSEREFRTRPGPSSPATPLSGNGQRFLHWEDGHLDEARLAEAFRRMEGYFSLGNPYDEWFDKYREFLAALDSTFESGAACHTDYVSPFATRTGISKVSRDGVRLLSDFGEPAWVEALSACPALEVVVGHGRGWKRVPDLLGDCRVWQRIPTPFDHKGPFTPRGHLHFTQPCLPTRRPLLAYWWLPNRDGAPFCYLSAREGGEVGQIVRAHAQQHGALK